MTNKEKCKFYDELMTLVELIWDEWCNEGDEK